MGAAKEPASMGSNPAISVIPGPSGLADPESSATAPAIENRNHQAMTVVSITMAKTGQIGRRDSWATARPDRSR
jgi:hypothetical protein